MADERLVHVWTGIEISKTLSRLMKSAAIDVEELPDTVTDTCDMIEEYSGVLKTIENQLELEAAGVTSFHKDDPKWPVRACNSASFHRKKLKVMHSWKRRLEERDQEQKEAARRKAKADLTQFKTDLENRVTKEVRHYRRMSTQLEHWIRSIKAQAGNLPDAHKRSLIELVGAAEADLLQMKSEVT